MRIPLMNENPVTYPDYQNCIVNLVSSILASFNVNTYHPPLKQLDHKNFGKNVVLIILDGFGINLLKKYKVDATSFFAEHYKDQITSVFPPTTAAAITSIITAKTPYEHGSVGWTMFFKEYAKYIDFLPIWDSTTTITLNNEKFKVHEMLGGENIFDMIHKQDPKIDLFNITLKGIAESANVSKNSGPAKILSYESSKDFCKRIEEAVKIDPEKRKFIYAYSSDPDHLEHIHGIYSDQVKLYLAEINSEIQNLTERLQGTDTTILITADHGLLDVKEYYYTNEDKELFDSIILPGFPEPRFISFFVKSNKIEQFKKASCKYEDNFIIMTREEFWQKNLFGNGNPHRKLDDFIGDYVFIAKSDKAMKPIYEQNGKWKTEFKAHHAGITAAEMLVPLIEINI